MCIVFNCFRFSKKNMILAGLWFDDEKPTMSTFLHPLMLEMNRLYEKGNNIVFIITYITYSYIIGLTIKSPDGDIPCKAILLMCCADLPARCLLLNMKQYNGKWGCCYCESKGTTRQTSCMHRNWIPERCDLRTCSSIKQNAIDAVTSGNPVSDLLSCLTPVLTAY